MKRLWNIFLVSAGIIAAVAFTGCREGEAHAEASPKESPRGLGDNAGSSQKSGASSGYKATSTNVKTVALAPTTLTEYIVANGTTKALRDVTYSAEVPGRIEFLPVDLGDRIRKGQVLARIDFATLEAQAEQAETSYDLAKSTYDRLSTLKDENIISKQRIDEAKTNMLSAESGVSIARANVKKAVVRSTYRGIVGAKFVEKGEFVNPGTPLFMVVDYKTIVVEARLAETQVARVNRSADVEVYIEALNKTFRGKVDTLIPTADKASKTFTLRVKIDNPDHEILIGMSATVKIDAIDHENVIAVPQSAVIEEAGSRSVFIAEKGVAKRHPVRLGASQGDRVIVLDGVEAGDELIVVGQRDLEDGKPIRVIP
jgi:membrane fusion protein (multidrug efflux system)